LKHVLGLIPVSRDTIVTLNPCCAFEIARNILVACTTAGTTRIAPGRPVIVDMLCFNRSFVTIGRWFYLPASLLTAGRGFCLAGMRAFLCRAVAGMRFSIR
jgi:hypothetical protein